MLTAVVVLLRSIGLLCRGHRAVALENLALRQQLAALTRTGKRPQLRPRDRFFWILLRKSWRDWQRIADRAPGHGRALASPMAPTSMDAAFTTEASGPAADGRRDSGPHRQDGVRQSALGRAADPWRVAQTGHRGVRTNRLAVRASPPATSVTDVANLPRESPLRAGLDGLLHCADADGPCVIRAGSSRP